MCQASRDSAEYLQMNFPNQGWINITSRKPARLALLAWRAGLRKKLKMKGDLKVIRERVTQP
jgi:hypothetical protein